VCEGSLFGNLRINGVTIAITGQPNQVVNLVGGGTIVINEQTVTGTGNFRAITANGLHVRIPGVADVIISSAHSDIVCALTP
jgi:glutamate synthase domain-containing protein 3